MWTMRHADTLMAAALAGVLVAGLASPGFARNEPPLRSGIDGIFAPHASPGLGGGLEDFNIDLAAELSKRMGREIPIDNATVSGLIPAPNAGRHEPLMALATLTRARAEERGREVLRSETRTDALQAVIAGRALASRGGSAAIPFRLGDTGNRHAVEPARECMKKDGTMAAPLRRWFGVDPAPDSAETTIHPGCGAPGFPGHDPTPHEAQC